MAGILDAAVGIQNYRDQEEKRAVQAWKDKLERDRLNETIRSNQADEGLRRDTNTESMTFRRLQQQQLDENRQLANEDRGNTRLTRTASFRRIGSPVTEQEMSAETRAGIPTSAYKPGEWQGGIVPPEMGEGPDRTRDITWTGTQAQEDAQQRLTDAQARAEEATRYHNLQNENTDLSRNLAREREDRIRGWGPPTIIIGDPNNPGASRVVPRSEANKPGGVSAPVPGAMQTQAVGNEVSTAQLDRLEEMFQGGGKDVIGPVAGRARGIGQNLPDAVSGVIPGMGNDQRFNDFQAASNAFKNSVIKAITGAQMSELEANRILGQIPLTSDKPDVWQAKAQQTRLNLQDLSKRIAARQGGTNTFTPVAGGGGGQRKVGRFIVEE